MQDFYVYILKCSDNSYYVGHTDDIEKRLAEHQQRFAPKCYTADRLPVDLVFVQGTPDRYDALAFERQIKKWTRRKKEALIKGYFKLVSKLAKKIF